MAEKEGLQSAVDFTKYLLALSGGAIAFVMQPTFYQDKLELKILSTFAIALLAICTLSGLAVFSRGCVMLSKGYYDLEDPFIKIPGLVNLFSFALGFLVLSYSIAVKIWG